MDKYNFILDLVKQKKCFYYLAYPEQKKKIE